MYPLEWKGYMGWLPLTPKKKIDVDRMSKISDHIHLLFESFEEERLLSLVEKNPWFDVFTLLQKVVMTSENFHLYKNMCMKLLDFMH